MPIFAEIYSQSQSIVNHPVKQQLEELYEEALRLRLTHEETRNPADFMLLYPDPQDKELVGLLGACLSFGDLDAYYDVLCRILTVLGGSPYAYCRSCAYPQLRSDLEGIEYKMFTTDDLASFLWGISHSPYSSLGALVARINQQRSFERNFRSGLEEFREAIYALLPVKSWSTEYLIPNPRLGGSCKRILLFFRWMVRNDGVVDIGNWSMTAGIHPESLILPMDAHVTAAVNRLRLVKERIKKATWDDALRVTNSLKRFDPGDPVRYDIGLYLVHRVKG